DVVARVFRSGPFLNQVVAAQVNLLIHVLVDHVIPIGKAAIQFGHAGLGLLLFLVEFVPLPVVLALDAVALGCFRIRRRRRLLILRLGGIGLARVGFGCVFFG